MISFLKFISGILLLGLIIVVGSDFPVRASEGKLPTVWAEGTVEEVRQAIAKGEKVNTEAGTLTPLMAAASDTVNGLEKVKLLLHAGANKNAKGPGNSTALLEAITKQNYPVALLLLSVGAEAYSTTDADQTALITAINALPAITSFKSDDPIIQSQIDAWRLLMESRTKPNSVTVKNNQLEGYTEIFGGNLSFKIPPYLGKEPNEISYSVYLHPDGQQSVAMKESIFSSPADGEAKFKSWYDEALKAPEIHPYDPAGESLTDLLNRLDDPVGESLTDVLNKPAFLVTTAYDSLIVKMLAMLSKEDTPDEGKKLEVLFPANLKAHLKFTQGYLEFDMSFDFDIKDPVSNQGKIKQNINAHKTNLVDLIKNLMPHYKWVGEKRVTIGSNYRTKYGLISRDGLYLNPKFDIALFYFVDDSYFSLDMTIGTHKRSSRDTSWLYTLLYNLKAHGGQEPKEFSLAFPRKVYGRWGMQLISFNNPSVYDVGLTCVTLTWTEFPVISTGSHDPLYIEANFRRLPPDFEPQFDGQLAWELWNNFLDNIEVLP